MNRRFRIYRCRCGFSRCGFWRWECSLCSPSSHGARSGALAWHRIVAISLPRHFRTHSCHHEWVRSHKGAKAA